MYYAPDRIPAEWRHEYSYEGGAFIGQSNLHADRGFRGMGNFAFATHEGGPRNGVLTAVEDFLEAARMPERPLAFAHVPAVFGLGVVFDSSAPWAADVAQIVHPYHDNPLMASLELNRLRNYLAVIDWQDRQAGLEPKFGRRTAGRQNLPIILETPEKDCGIAMLNGVGFLIILGLRLRQLHDLGRQVRDHRCMPCRTS
jgi:hypothetical protein